MGLASRKVVVGLGELLWDCFGAERRPGGAPANVAYHAQQLGAQGVVCSRVGVDTWGAELAAFLQDHGLDPGHVQRDDRHLTGRVTVHLESSQGPTYTIHEDVAWDHLAWTPEWQALARGAAAVCFGTLAQRSPESRATIHHFLEAATHALRVYDINLRPPYYARHWIDASLAQASVLKLNEDEWVHVNELLEIRAADAQDFCRAIMDRYQVSYVFLTRGSAGCLAMDQHGGCRSEPGIAVEVADPVGAGDAFTAAAITAILEGWPLSETARFANRTGALIASYPGAMPQVAEAVAALIADVRGEG